MRNRRIQWNIGLVVFVCLFLYMLVHVFIYLSKEKISVYKVAQDKVNESYTFTGIAIRDESLLTAEESGYITYYVEDGKRVIKNGVFFVIDADGKVQKELANQTESKKKSLSTSDKEAIRTKLSDYESIHSDDSFDAVYDLKNDMKSTLLNMNESSINQIISNVDQKSSSFVTQKSDASGICSFYTDSFDGKTMDQIKKSDFNQDNYRVVKYNSTSKVKKGQVVARIAKNETWNIVISLSKKQYMKLKDRTSVSLTFNEDEIKANAKLSVEKKGKNYFGYLTLNDYCVRYYLDRYIDFDISLESYSGYKIPNSAIVKKEFYRVPVSYISKGNNSTSEGFSIRATNKSGETKVEQMNYTIYKKGKKYCYLDPNDVEEGTTMISMNGGASFTVGKKVSLPGVYCTNQGYADFRLIDIMKQGDNYTMIQTNTKNGIKRYDFIVLDSDTMKENQIIY